MRFLVIQSGPLPADAATIDHIHSRFSPLRARVHTRQTVLACNECNDRRNKEEHAERKANGLPMINPERQKELALLNQITELQAGPKGKRR